jgi:hypothetical protein
VLVVWRQGKSQKALFTSLRIFCDQLNHNLAAWLRKQHIIHTS